MIGPFRPVEPPDVNVAVVNEYSSGPAALIKGIVANIHLSRTHENTAIFDAGIVHVLLFSDTLIEKTFVGITCFSIIIVPCGGLVSVILNVARLDGDKTVSLYEFAAPEDVRTSGPAN
jgi:hypothetical protein